MSNAIENEPIRVLTDLSVEPTVSDVKFILARDGRSTDGISVYVRDLDEYFPVSGIGVSTEDDSLSAGEIVLIC